MPFLEIVPATFKLAHELACNLRQKDQDEARATGLNPKKATLHTYKTGLWRRVALVDGKVAAMWGVAGNPLGLIGQPFLVTTKELEKIRPITFARQYKKEVEVMKTLFPVLENYVDSAYVEACKMLRIAGFELEGPFPVPPFNRLFYKFRITV